MTEAGSPEQAGSPPEPAAGFSTTHWSVVLAASNGTSDTTAFNALSELCRTYWRPLYAFLRRRGHSAEDAEDLVQEFFHTLLTSNSLQKASPEKGRFRNFILKTLQNFASNARRHREAWRRGGRTEIVPLEAFDVEQLVELGAASEQPAESVFDRVWARTVLQNAGDQLRREYGDHGDSAVYEAISRWLVGKPEPGDYEATAVRLGVAPATIPVLVHRLRQRMRELMRREVARTVASPEEIEPEVRYLVDLITLP